MKMSKSAQSTLHKNQVSLNTKILLKPVLSRCLLGWLEPPLQKRLEIKKTLTCTIRNLSSQAWYPINVTPLVVSHPEVPNSCQSNPAQLVWLPTIKIQLLRAKLRWCRGSFSIEPRWLILWGLVISTLGKIWILGARMFRQGLIIRI